jgi:tetratricopeptide (TPR) repeat protein
MHEAACAASRSSRGRAFARAARRIGRQSFDACEPQPITEITRREVSFRSTGFGTARGGPPVDPALRLYRHALGLSHGVSERLDEARPSIQRALELTDATGIEPQLAELAARIAGRQGRLDEANSWLLRAAGRRPGEPAVARTRGRSHARLWQWPDAATALGEAARAGSRDPTLWAELAQAQASAGDAEAALSSAITGLELAPRHPALLRSQALALDELGRDARRARAAFLAHRRPDALPRLRRRCDEQEPTCARDRQPIVRIRMRPGSANVQRP